MSRYTLIVMQTVEHTLTVEAESLDAAKDCAFDVLTSQEKSEQIISHNTDLVGMACILATNEAGEVV